MQAENQKRSSEKLLGLSDDLFIGFTARIFESDLLLFKQKRFNRRHFRIGGDSLLILTTVFQIPISQDFRRIPADTGISADGGQSVFPTPYPCCFKTVSPR
ncbi:hypothetical protein [Neisseria sicca]